MEAKNLLDVEKFVVTCNDVLSGKFLDLNKRLDKFLAVMTKSEDIIDLLADCLQDFDDEVEFAKAFSIDKKSGAVKVAIPSDDAKRLALCTTIFNDIINEKLNANQFLETYFQDSKLTPTQNFLEKIIKPYRDSICKIFEIKNNLTAEDIKRQLSLQTTQEVKEETEEVEDEFPHLDELLKEVEKTCNQILALLKFEKKRTDVLDDVEFVVNSIIKSCEKRDLMVINGLVIGLNYVAKKFKGIKSFVASLNNMIFDYYEYLAQLSEETEQEEESEEEPEE